MNIDWILERSKERLIVRMDLNPRGFVGELYPQQFRGMLIGRTGSHRQPMAAGFISFEVMGNRLQHFHVFASPDEAKFAKEIGEWAGWWKDEWAAELEHVFKISHTHLRGDADEVPMCSLLATSYLALTQGLLYQAERAHRTKAENALVRDISYKFSKVVANANAKLYAGI